MKLTKSKLQQIIKEELGRVLKESDWYDDKHETRADWKYADRPKLEEEYPEHYKFLQDVMEKGYVGDKRSEKYMTLLMWLENGRLEGLEAIDEWDARKLIDAAREESNRARWERDRKWKEENPDTRTPEERQAASDRSMAAAYKEDPDRFTFGT
tara:strand:- start:164 stop:625 length:462 start_codon:yes stop_codon:yes gene_type:complete